MNRMIDGLFWFAAFLVSTTLHEAAHAFVAMRGGDKTAYHGGQVSLSPIPHIKREPIGMLAVPLLTALTQGYAWGWASAPFDPRWAERHPRKAAWMAAAGPLTNLSLAVFSFAALRGGLALGYFVVPPSVSYSHLVGAAGQAGASIDAFFAQALSVMLMLNVMLGVFNLLPLPPLDGASAVELVLPDHIAIRMRRLVRNPSFSLVGLLLAWQVFPYITRPLFAVVLRLLYPSVSFH